ncbi:MAG: phosphoribosylanthranilate isomerase [Thermodesulfobacteriota bacterium]
MTGHPDRTVPQVKICGLTDADQALACAELGADAIGLVFFPKSPRHVTLEKAREIAGGLPPDVASIGVFVNADYDVIMETVSRCGLTGVQLHGQEPPGLVERLVEKKLRVVKVLFIGASPAMESAPEYRATAYLVECAGGKLPGGNAMAWDWKAARPLGKDRPVILAGGLTADNVARAISDAEPDAVDVSSGVEIRPGRKDLEKVAAFIAAVYRSDTGRFRRRVF